VPDDGTPIIRATVNVVLVPTSVSERKGRTVNGLKPSDFTLTDNGKPQQINRDVAFLPLSMVICIDRSSHVETVLPKIRKMGGVVHDMLVGQEGEAAIIAFDHRVEVIQDFTDDADKIDAAIEKLTPGSQSDRLNDSVQMAARLLRRKKDRRKVILLISETLDRSSEVGTREVSTELQLYNIDVFTVNVNRFVARLSEKPQVPRPERLPPGALPTPGIASNDPTTTAQIYGTQGQAGDFAPLFEEVYRLGKGIFVKNPAEAYTKMTGGREYHFLTLGDLEKAIVAIGAEIRSQYLLSYSPNNKLEGGFHKIVVHVNRPNLRVRTRPGYWMAAVPD
jgi:VWFA-related protein